MAGRHAAVSVATTATRLDTATETDRVTGSSIAFYNASTVNVFVGVDNTVTTTTGATVAAGSWSPTFQLADDEALWAIVASGTADVRVVELGI